MKTFIQKLGKSLMGPLSIIVAAGLLLGLASTLHHVKAQCNDYIQFCQSCKCAGRRLVWSSSDSVLYVCGTGYVKGRP